mgnify:CR=1 FL=1
MKKNVFSSESKKESNYEINKKLKEKLRNIIIRRDSKNKKQSENINNSFDSENEKNNIIEKKELTEKENEQFEYNDKRKIREKVIFFKQKNFYKINKEKDDLNEVKKINKIENKKISLLNKIINNKIDSECKTCRLEKQEKIASNLMNKFEEKYNKEKADEKLSIKKPFDIRKNLVNSFSNKDVKKDEALQILELIKNKKNEQEMIKLKESEDKKKTFKNNFINNNRNINQNLNDIFTSQKRNSYKYNTYIYNKKTKSIFENNKNDNSEEKENKFENNNIFFKKKIEQIKPKDLGIKTKKSYFRNAINISFNKYFNISKEEQRNSCSNMNSVQNYKLHKNLYNNNTNSFNKNNSENEINYENYISPMFTKNIIKKNQSFQRNRNNNLFDMNFSEKNIFRENYQKLFGSLDLDSYRVDTPKKVYTPKKAYIKTTKSLEKKIIKNRINKQNKIPISPVYYKNINLYNSFHNKKKKSSNSINNKPLNRSFGEKQTCLKSPISYYSKYNSIKGNNFDTSKNFSNNQIVNNSKILMKKKIIHNKNKYSSFNKIKIKKNYLNNMSKPIEILYNERDINNNKLYNNYIKQNIPNNSLDRKKNENYGIKNNLHKYHSNLICNNSKKKSKIKPNKIMSNYKKYIEELLILEDKFNLIVFKIENAESKSISNHCFEFLNYYFNSIFYQKIDMILKGSKYFETIKLFIKYVLLSIIICYDLSLDNDTIDMHLKFSEMLELNFKSFIIILELLYDKIYKDKHNFWLKNLTNKIYNWKYLDEPEKNKLDENNSSKMDSIKNNINLINIKIADILINYSQTINKCINNLYKKILDKSIEDINYFFREYILREENLGCSILASSYLKHSDKFIPEKVPYLHNINTKKFTLVLDLDETLLHFKIEESNEEGILKLRPGIFKFLEEVSKYYELVLFSEASQEYVDLIMNAFEGNIKYFDYKLYRQHTVIMNQDFIKDLTRLGRPLNTVIIVDNMPQNFRLQKLNGIAIKSFWGEDNNDKVLFDLASILIKIAKEYDDVRNGLIRYHQEIATKIISNVFKHYK